MGKSKKRLAEKELRCKRHSDFSRAEVLQVLVDRKAGDLETLHTKDAFGLTLLERARNNPLEHAVEVQDLLEDEGAALEDSTPLLLAACQGSAARVAELLRDPDAALEARDPGRAGSLPPSAST